MGWVFQAFRVRVDGGENWGPGSISEGGIAFIALRSWQQAGKGDGVVSATMQSTGSAAVTGSDSDGDIGLRGRISNGCSFQRQHQNPEGWSWCGYLLRRRPPPCVESVVQDRVH